MQNAARAGAAFMVCGKKPWGKAGAKLHLAQK
jgi:hypothetical protein